MSKKIYLEDVLEMIENIESGIHYSIVDVFREYFPADELTSRLEDEDIKENSSNC